MADLFDYLLWRGDLSLTADPFNEIDSLILSRLSYVPLEGIVPWDFAHTIPLKEAARLFLSREDAVQRVLMQEDLPLLEALAASPRFCDLPLSGCVSRLDFAQEEQFAALTIGLGPRSHFIAYRGTDNTLVGWKEDFNMAFLTPVPSQQHGLDYFRQAAAFYPGDFRLGGHSKGGNLAVYAAAFCPSQLQARIVHVYNNDGPGFGEGVLNQPGYAAICHRLSTFVPQSSVVGMLLEHEEHYTIIHSHQVGVLQHNVYSWEVLRNGFVCLEEQLSDSSRILDRTLKDWVRDMDREHREVFFDTLYSILIQTNARTLSELTGNWLKNAKLISETMKNLDNETRQMINRTLRQLMKCAGYNLSLEAREKLKLPKSGAPQ